MDKASAQCHWEQCVSKLQQFHTLGFFSFFTLEALQLPWAQVQVWDIFSCLQACARVYLPAAMSRHCIYNNTQTSHYDKQNILGSAAACLCPELTVPRSLDLPHTQSLLTQCLCTRVSCLTVYCRSPPSFSCAGLIFHFHFFSSNVVFLDRASPLLVLKLGNASVVIWLSKPFPQQALASLGP